MKRIASDLIRTAAAAQCHGDLKFLAQTPQNLACSGGTVDRQSIKGRASD
ncbi:MAG: hypothetical protein RIT52_1915, partial [Pseudomonadota bacterium]